MKFMEAIRHLSEGQMVVSNSARNSSDAMTLKVRWDWGASDVSYAAGYIPVLGDFSIVDLPRPRIKAADVVTRLLHRAEIDTQRIDALTDLIVRALSEDNIDWQ
jgi:altronate dehydratase